ncbi:hypothetical protein MS3_00008400 [Schistosoma haematobium]|uniref:Uncharacterized protein n=2 Tax=Schistosoma haematobium TaxID=6185 RepID=A0A6A5D7H4_SCHHA|nr:hypothetical protein MS3_00008400 [Schistosoma haematobium]KAH9581188.1 hypothetical protein MS3_00008400 [Schistosoma haematobium]CAH8624520.1 unnamed protein product [Schistosoma haematobium]
MLDIEVVPELGIRHKLWEFVLGMPIQQMIDILRKQDHTIKNVDFWYSDKDPFSMNLVLVLPDDGVKFHFDPFLQRLRIIEVFDLSSITLRYWSQYFNSPSILPTMQEVLRIFGSTKPLAPAESDGDYQLTYRGITFILRRFSTGSRESIDSKSDLLATRLLIYLGSNLAEAKVPVELPSACYLQNVFLERLEVNRSVNSTTDLTLHLVAQDLNVNPNREPQIRRFTRSLTFGDSVQDVLSALGSPSRVFYKTEDKMKIHLPQSHRLVQPRKSDYFFNYFPLGLDILFDAQTHEVMKFVLHTNQPGEYTFNTYYRCLFEIPIPIVKSSKENTNTETDETYNVLNETKYLVTPFSKWSDVRQHLISSMDTEPVVIYRESKPQQNPFGPTHAYGYQDIIFEIIPTSECIASVTLYTPIHLSKT